MIFNPYNAAVVLDGSELRQTRDLTPQRVDKAGSLLVMTAYDRNIIVDMAAAEDARIAEGLEDQGWEILISHRAPTAAPIAAPSSAGGLFSTTRTERWMLLCHHPTHTPDMSAAVAATIARRSRTMTATLTYPVHTDATMRDRSRIAALLGVFSGAVQSGDIAGSHAEFHRLAWKMPANEWSQAEFMSRCPTAPASEIFSQIGEMLDLHPIPGTGRSGRHHRLMAAAWLRDAADRGRIEKTQALLTAQLLESGLDIRSAELQAAVAAIVG